MHVLLPVRRNPVLGAGDVLGDGVVLGVGEPRAGDDVVQDVVPEPVLARLERLDDGVPGLLDVVPVACWHGEVSQQPTWPHWAQRRRCTHHPAPASHSTQPGPLGGTVGSIPEYDVMTTNGS